MKFRQSLDLMSSIIVFLDLYLKASKAPPNTLTGLSLDERDSQIIEQLMPFFGWIYQDYFRVQTDGWEHIPKTGKVLLIGSPDLLGLALGRSHRSVAQYSFSSEITYSCLSTDYL